MDSLYKPPPNLPRPNNPPPDPNSPSQQANVDELRELVLYQHEYIRQCADLLDRIVCLLEQKDLS